jgi:hypothetical protein
MRRQCPEIGMRKAGRTQIMSYLGMGVFPHIVAITGLAVRGVSRRAGKKQSPPMRVAESSQ